MRRLTDTKLILVTRPTRVAELKRRFNTLAQAQFYVSHLGQDFSDYEREDERYAKAVQDVRNTLETLGRFQSVDRSFLPNFVFGPDDVVVVVGQDGLVANTVKYLQGQPVIAANPDPARWDGLLLPFVVSDLDRVVPEVLRKERPTKAVTMAQATLNTGETRYAVNDLFIGPRSHTSARYIIEQGQRSENQSSSGLIVSTGLGSTGWLTSLLVGASAISRSVGNPDPSEPGALSARPPRLPGSTSSRRATQSQTRAAHGFPWDASHLCFTVRGPFPSKTTQAEMVFGRVTASAPLTLISQMPENGVILSDGIEADFLEFRPGARATIAPAQRQGHLVI